MTQKDYEECLNDMFSSYYRYFLGVLFASYTKEHSDMKNVLALNEHINDDDFTYNFTHDLIENFKKNIEKDKVCKK